MVWVPPILRTWGEIVGKQISDELKDGFSSPEKNRNYYTGNQKKQLKVLPNKTDDNIRVNLSGLAVDRSVSHTLAKGITFKLPEKKDDQQEFINDLWEANKKIRLLTDAILKASVFGTGYIKIKPDGIVDPYSGELFPRLIALNPEFVTIETDPHDAEDVTAYVISYTVKEGDQAVVYRETTRKAESEDYVDPESAPEGNWLIISEKRIENESRWTLVDQSEFPYNFPPIIHWKNLPSLDSVYGTSDLDDIPDIQDKENFVLSNLQKMVRLQAHKQPWGRSIGDNDKLDVGPDKLIKLANPDAQLGLLDFTADISGSLSVSHDLRQTLFDITREVDITSMADKIGQITNFGLHILYSDTLSKMETKRNELTYTLQELNRRLLIMKGYEGEESRPGEVIWTDPLPSDRMEDVKAISEALAMKIISKQTAAERLGFNWKDELLRLAEEESNNSSVLGSNLLSFFGGK